MKNSHANVSNKTTGMSNGRNMSPGVRSPQNYKYMSALGNYSVPVVDGIHTQDNQFSQKVLSHHNEDFSAGDYKSVSPAKSQIPSKELQTVNELANDLINSRGETRTGRNPAQEHHETRPDHNANGDYGKADQRSDSVVEFYASSDQYAKKAGLTGYPSSGI